jgi:hypothetical protein
MAPTITISSGTFRISGGAATIAAAPPPVLFLKTLSGGSNDQGTGISEDSSGNFLLAGTTTSQGEGSTDLLAVKYDIAGDIVWQRAIGTASGDSGTAIQGGPSDDVYVAGTNFLAAPNFNSGFVCKFNSSGTIQWQRTLANGVAAIMQFFGCDVDSSGNLYAAGRETNPSPSAGMIIKYNSSGTIQWQRQLQGSLGAGQINDVAVDSTGSNIYVVGYDIPSTQNAHVAKYDSSGTLIWQRSLGGAGSDEFTGCAVDSSDNVYCVGETSSEGEGADDVLIAKYDSSGTFQWQRILGGATNNFRSSIAVDSSSNVYVSFESVAPTVLSMAKYNSSGTIQWQRTLAGATSDTPGRRGAIVHDGDGGFAVSATTSPTEVLIFKAPDDGSGTGTFGSYTYAAGAFVGATSTLTDAAGTLVGGTPTLTDAAGSAVVTNTTLTETSIAP